VALPETIRVKISSEAAEFISVTPVVVREMPARELLEAMLGVTGKDATRVRDILHRGSLVEGASRFRWDAFDADQAAVESLLATFPDPDPARPFAAGLCLRAVLKGPNTRIEIPRQVGSERRLFRKSSFWDLLMEVALVAAPRYLGYSYRDRADRYTFTVPPAEAVRLCASAGTIRYSGLEAQVRRARLDSIDLYVERPR
jgi:hypothetical protein